MSNENPQESMVEGKPGTGARWAAPPSLPGTPFSWRILIASSILALVLIAYWLRNAIGVRGQAACGVVCFFGLIALCSSNLRAVNWRTIGWGIVLQAFLAVFILKFEVHGLTAIGIRDGFRPGFELFRSIADVVTKFVEFTDEGAKFVFGPLADPAALRRAFGENNGFVFAFSALPAIIFVSSFFTVLYYFGVLQFIVRVLAKCMMYLMGTSGAETLSAVANVFMGQTEAPLIVKPYVARMTQSELLALMVGGMATISGGIMVVYIRMGADPVAILATSVMAAPCGLYLSKLLLPELGRPETSGEANIDVEIPHRNVVDAAAAGASDGMSLAINVAAMLIAFIAFIALINAVMKGLPTGQTPGEVLTEADPGTLALAALAGVIGFLLFRQLVRVVARVLLAPGDLPRVLGGAGPWTSTNNLCVLSAMLFVFVNLFFLVLWLLPAGLTLQRVFSFVFAPVAFLMGIDGPEVESVANLLGIKLVGNEFLAYAELTSGRAGLTPHTRAYILSTYALTGFANFASIGIQLGGIGAMAPSRRSDLARLGLRALFVGFVATLVNAAVAGMLLDI